MQEVFTDRPKQEPLEDELELEQITEAIKGLGEEIGLLPEKAVNKQDMFPEQAEIKQEKLKSKQSGHQQEKKRTAMNRVKPFKEMDIQERLDYLINFPKVLPPVPCVFYTDQNNYQGYLSEYDDQQITIKLYDQTNKTIPLHELKNILMIGIKR